MGSPGSLQKFNRESEVHRTNHRWRHSTQLLKTIESQIVFILAQVAEFLPLESSSFVSSIRILRYHLKIKRFWKSQQ